MDLWMWMRIAAIVAWCAAVIVSATSFEGAEGVAVGDRGKKAAPQQLPQQRRQQQQQRQRHRNAYAAMMYMGTPRDYEFYVATRVMMRSLRKLNVDADLVVIASVDVPLHWVRAL